MSLKLVLGTMQKDKHALMLKDLKQQLKQYPQDNFIWLVPDHVKFEREVQILTQLKSAPQQIIATNRLQVFSFSRLAWYFLRNDPIYQSPQLTQTTKVMLLADIVQQQAGQLHLYGGEVKHIGFIQDLQQQLDNFIKNHITPQRLQMMAQDISQTGDLHLKLLDLSLIYEQYWQKITTNYNDEHQLLTLLTQFLRADPQQQQLHYFISDFTQFSAEELLVLQAILTHAATVEISLTLDHPVNDQQTTPFFQRPQQVFQWLTQTCRQEDVAYTTQVAQARRVTADLACVEDFWIAQNTQLTHPQPEQLQDDSSVQIWQASTQQQELLAVTTYIRQLVATQGYRYRDFLVLARNLTDYQQIIDPYFQNQGLSYFVDLPHSMRDHAFKDVIDSLFALVQNNLQYADIMRLLRTELVVPQDLTLEQYRQAVDLTDNYCLAHGLQARDWLAAKDFAALGQHPTTEIQHQFKQINTIKHLVTHIYHQVQQLVQQEITVQQACSQLYQLLVDLQVFANLKQWETAAIDQGNLALSQQPEQVVNTFVQILDEFVDLFGTQKFAATEFLIVLDNGFDEAQYLTIPAALDAVQISGLGAQQVAQRKITIILGANDQDMPQVNEAVSLFSDDDLAALQPLLTSDETLPPTKEQLNSFEPYLHDLAFLSSSQRLIFTYAQTKNEAAVQLSPYVRILKQHFQITEQVVDFVEPTSPTAVLQLLGSPVLTADHLLAVYRHSKTQQIPVAPAWQAIKDLLFQSDGAAQQYLSKIWSGLSYQNIAVPLTAQISQQLYGQELTVSISQLETFYQNPYEYFLKYGLGLKPRPEFKITPANQGTFFHEVMDLTVKQLQMKGIAWSELQAKQLQAIAQQVIEQVLAQPAYQIFSHNEQFIQQRMVMTVQQSLEVLRQQAQDAQFTPWKTEVTFGQVGAQHDLQPLRLELADDHQIIVRGRIDRIDQLESDPNYYFVVDYKSSARDFDFKKFYAGLDLQMMTYLTSLLNDSSLFNGAMLPVGGFYFHLQNPAVNVEDLKGDLSQAANLWFKQYQYKGLIIDDGKSALALDPSIDETASQVFQIGKKHRVLASKVVSPTQFQQMVDFNQKLIKQAARQIFQGVDAISPLRLNRQQTTLQYSDYLPIMQFDAMLPENQYRNLTKLNKKQFFELLQHEKEQK